MLASFTVPHAALPARPGGNEAARKAQIAADLARMAAQADAFEAGNPGARVVRIANADHFIFRSNEAEVLREMNAFLAGLS